MFLLDRSKNRAETLNGGVLADGTDWDVPGARYNRTPDQSFPPTRRQFSQALDAPVHNHNDCLLPHSRHIHIHAYLPAAVSSTHRNFITIINLFKLLYIQY